jgi:drug/metabolite transporter (DMT)-like permease
MSTKLPANYRYIVEIIILIGFGIFTWWVQQYALQKTAGVNQLALFMYFVIGYAAVILALNALRFRIRANLKYLAGIIFLTGFGALTWYTQEYFSSRLAVFLSFILVFLAAVLVFYYFLGRTAG